MKLVFVTRLLSRLEEAEAGALALTLCQKQQTNKQLCASKADHHILVKTTTVKAQELFRVRVRPVVCSDNLISFELGNKKTRTLEEEKKAVRTSPND